MLKVTDYLTVDPLTDFVIVLILILLIPRLFDRIRIPGIVGLLIAGALLGPKGIGLLSADREVLSFLASVGKLMVMFFAGLEIDFEEFIKNGHKSLTFGVTTFIFPLFTGTCLGLIFGCSFLSSIVLGSLLASHTLIALPILIRCGILRKESIAVTVGATMFTDVAALVLLAICVTIHTKGFSARILVTSLTGIVIFLPLLLLAARWISKHSLRLLRDNEDEQILFAIIIMILTAVGAEAIHLEGIVGAFIGGLAVGEVLREGPARKKLDLLGNTMFISLFFLIVGTLMDPLAFARITGENLVLVFCIVIGLFGSKYLAAWIASRLLHYTRTEQHCMWSLSVPQVSATLAAALVAYEAIDKTGERLISESIFDAALMLVMVTAIAGPLLTQRFANQLAKR